MNIGGFGNPPYSLSSIGQSEEVKEQLGACGLPHPPQEQAIGWTDSAGNSGTSRGILGEYFVERPDTEQIYF
jgi:hypothetical protein